MVSIWLIPLVVKHSAGDGRSRRWRSGRRSESWRWVGSALYRRRRGSRGDAVRPPISLHGLRHRLEPAQQREALALEPFRRRLVPVAERGPARLETHRRSEEGRLLSPGLDQVKLGARVLDPERRQAEWQEVLAVDAAGLLHDRVQAGS